MRRPSFGRLMPLIFALCMLLGVTTVSKYVPVIKTMYYVALVGYTVMWLGQLITRGAVYGNKRGMIFAIICFISVLVNEIYPFFRPWQRLISFICLLFMTGNLFYNAKMKRFIGSVVLDVKVILIIIAVISLPVELFGLTTFKIYFRGFAGITNQSMMLAPISAMAVLFLLEDILSQPEDTSRRHKWLMWILFVMSGASLALAASRGALGAFIVALVAYILIRYWGKTKLVRYTILFSVLLALTVITNPGGVMDNFNEKMEQKELAEDVTSGRDVMWQDRIDDFKMSPVIGVGLNSAVNIKNSKVDTKRGIIESGSSWLLILSSTGILGLLAFVNVTFSAVIGNIWRKRNSVLVAIAIFFLVHSTVEGYVTAAGSPLAFLFWLTIGALNMNKKEEDVD